MRRSLRRRIAIVVLVIAAGLNLASGENTPDGTVNTTNDSLSRRIEKLHFYEHSFRPSTYDMPVQFPEQNDRTEQTVRSPAAYGATSHVTIAAPETVQGFRVQIINTNRYDESAAIRTALLTTFDTWWVYVMFDSPTYKVRIGDFQSRLEAKRAMELILSKGFSGAWVVPDKVILHLPPRMPLPQPIDSTLTQ